MIGMLKKEVDIVNKLIDKSSEDVKKTYDNRATAFWGMHAYKVCKAFDPKEVEKLDNKDFKEYYNYFMGNYVDPNGFLVKDGIADADHNRSFANNTLISSKCDQIDILASPIARALDTAIIGYKDTIDRCPANKIIILDQLTEYRFLAAENQSNPTVNSLIGKGGSFILDNKVQNLNQKEVMTEFYSAKDKTFVEN